jgi:crotonobetainyl-CoA:carnitine CoA-transferase CaiB-like acyl-CoA transferase
MTESAIDLPLEGLLVVDFSQFLSGPFASLRLADFGARVIKIERPEVGDLCRQIYLTDTEIGGDSTLFHAINRRKESFAGDLKSPRDLERLRKLIARADVLIQNFRPGVMDRLGFDYETVKTLNPRLVYGTISGYGADGPWAPRPGQDLLAQARSGLLWLNGDRDDPPTPVGLAIADMLAGHNLAEGILACLVRRGVTGKGGLVETSLFEGLIDFQFEVLTTHLNDGERAPRRAAINNAHAYLSAPYGVYPTKDGYLAIAMTPVPKLGELLEIPALDAFSDPSSWFNQRDEIKAIIADRLAAKTTEHWLAILEPADIWCAPVYDWAAMRAHEGYRSLKLEQHIYRDDGVDVRTTRGPIRIDEAHLTSPRAAPTIGMHTEDLVAEFDLDAG